VKITKISAQAKNQNRVNIYVDDKFALSLDIYQVAELGLRVGAEIDEERLTELVGASEFGKVYARTLEWALMRPRSEHEIRDYLWRRAHKPIYMKDRDGKVRRDEDGKPMKRERVAVDTDAVIARLSERGYVDDEKFARYWVENRFVKKGVSQKRLRLELVKKGVSSATIDAVLTDGRDELAEAMKMAERKRARYDDEKLAAYLTRQGFGWDVVQEVICRLAQPQADETD
jgi:regulatory protein